MAHAKPIAKTIKIPIYDRELIVANSSDAAERLLHRRYKIWFDLEARSTCLGMTVMIESIGLVVVIVSDNSSRTMCHESIHAAWEVLRYAGVDSNVNNQEPLAYLTDWIYHEGTKALRLK